MAEQHGPDGSETSPAAAVEVAVAALLSVWDQTRERSAARLSAAQLRVLLVVERHDGINLRRLGSQLDMLLSSASRLCDRLAAAGMLEREPGRSDRREISLHLTEDGRSLLHRLRAQRRERLVAVLAAMSPGGQQALLRGLREFEAAAGAPDGAADRTTA